MEDVGMDEEEEEQEVLRMPCVGYRRPTGFSEQPTQLGWDVHRCWKHEKAINGQSDNSASRFVAQGGVGGAEVHAY